jgi:lipopolysaccharide export LptBFGC system permease protein LptF
METKFQTSFIPKKPVVEERRNNSSISLFLLLSIIVFLISLGLGGWVFIQKDLLIKNIQSAEEVIKSNQGAFELDTIESMIRLDSRIKIAKDLLANHVSISPIFSFLEDKTLKSVRFKSFNFTSAGKDEGGASIIKVTMTGQARDFKTIALQAEEFGNVNYRNIIKNPVFSDLNLTSDGSVSFSASMLVVPSFLSYSKSVVGNQ